MYDDLMTNPNKLPKLVPLFFAVAVGASACTGGEGQLATRASQADPQPKIVGPATCKEILVSYNPQNPYYANFTLDHSNADVPGLRHINEVRYNFGDNAPVVIGINTTAFHEYATAGTFKVNAGIGIADSYGSPIVGGGASCPPVEVTVPHR
jgi:hypothetical protein